jgi:cytochrome c5
MPLIHAIAVAVLLVASGVSTSSAVQPDMTAVITAEQAAEGRKNYQNRCASCHAGDLGGKDDAPALTGDSFLATWGAKSTKELFEFVRTTMPPDGTAIAPDEYLTILAHMLQQNGATAGTQPLTAGTDARISAVTGKAKPFIHQ